MLLNVCPRDQRRIQQMRLLAQETRHALHHLRRLLLHRKAALQTQRDTLVHFHSLLKAQNHLIESLCRVQQPPEGVSA